MKKGDYGYAEILVRKNGSHCFGLYHYQGKHKGHGTILSVRKGIVRFRDNENYIYEVEKDRIIFIKDG